MNAAVPSPQASAAPLVPSPMNLYSLYNCNIGAKLPQADLAVVCQYVWGQHGGGARCGSGACCIRGLHVGQHYSLMLLEQKIIIFDSRTLGGEMVLACDEPPPFLGFDASQVAQMFLVLGSCGALMQEARDLARVAHRMYGHVKGPLLATLEMTDLQNDLKPDNSSPLIVHYRELQLAICQYRPDETPPDETPPGKLRGPSESGTPDAGLTQVWPESRLSLLSSVRVRF